jgi:hypothetical protein
MSATTRTTYKSPSGSIAVDSLTKQVLTVVNQLLRLPQFGGETENMTGLQGSYRPYTKYSGTTHTGCAAVDLTAYNWRNRLILFDLCGIDAFHRLTSDGDWPEHMHLALRGMGCAASSLKGQNAEVKQGGDGLVGSKPDRDRHLRSLLWPLAVYNGRTGKLKSTTNTNLRTGPSYERDIIRPAMKGTVVNAIMEVNFDGNRWFVTDLGEWGFSGKWSKVGVLTPTPKQYPSQLLNLTNWKMTMPVGVRDHPLEVKQPELATYKHDRFFWAYKSRYVVFRTPVNGVTTENSDYPRSELREMTNNGKSSAKWSNRSGIHTLSGTLRINHLPAKKPQGVVAQIHDPDDDVVMIRATAVSDTHAKIEAVWSKGKNQGTVNRVLDPSYPMHRDFSYTIIASKSGIVVNYLPPGSNEWVQSKNPKTLIRDNCYFKAGMYCQSNDEIESNDSEYAECAYLAGSLQIRHAA